MANAWQTLSMANPQRADVTPLINAMTYKQQNYDANTMQIQQMIDQYANTDIMKDIDKQYFTERLQTLVGYINQSGTRDWSRKSLVNDISAYLATSLDQNVVNAISSTKQFRKQQAEIENIKQTKPELYSAQNEWHATQDLQRYLQSEVVGDKYRPIDYRPYVNVKDEVLKYADKLKDFNVEYVPFENGNGYFRQIGTKERISPEKARQMLSGIMDARILDQLSIDGLYTYRNTPTEELKKEYNSYLDSNSEAISDRILSLRASLKVEKNPDNKKQLQEAISDLEKEKSNITTAKGREIDRTTLANSLYLRKWENAWTGLLSYERVKDWKIDDSNFQLAKFDYQMKKDAADANFRERQHLDKMNLEYAKLAQQKLANKISAKSSGYILDENGRMVIDPYDPNNGVSTTESTVTKETDEKTYAQIRDEYDKQYTDVAKMLMSKAAGNENIQEFLKQNGLTNNVTKSGSKLVGLFMNKSDSFFQEFATQLGLNEATRNQLLDLRAKDKSLKTFYSTAGKDFMKQIQDNIGIVKAPGTKENAKKAFNYATRGVFLDESGKLYDYSESKNHKESPLNDVIKSFNYYTLGDDDNIRAKRSFLLNYLKTNSKLSNHQIQEIMDKMVVGGKNFGNVTGKSVHGLRWKALGSMLSESWNSLIGDSHTAQKMYEERLKYMNEASELAERKDKNKEFLFKNVGKVNQDFASLGGGDYDYNKTSNSPDAIRGALEKQIKDGISNLSSTTYLKPVDLIIDMKAKNSNVVIQGMKSFFNESGVEYVPMKDTQLRVSLNEDGNAFVTGTFKAIGAPDKASEYRQFKIPSSEIPAHISGMMNIDGLSPTRAASPNAIPYTNTFVLPKDGVEFTNLINKKTSMSERLSLLQQLQSGNLETQDSVLYNALARAKFSGVYSESLKKEIQEIINSPIQLKTEKDGELWRVNVYRKTKNGDEFLDNIDTIDKYNATSLNDSAYSVALRSIQQKIDNLIANKILTN